MPYSPPSGHAVNLDFGAIAYTPPSGHAVNLDLSPSFTQTVLPAGLDAAAFGSTTVIPVNTVLPTGFDAAAMAGGDSVILLDQFLVSVSAGERALFGAPTVYNLRQYVSNAGGDATPRFGGPNVYTGTNYLFVPGYDANLWGTAAASNVNRDVAPSGYEATLWGDNLIIGPRTLGLFGVDQDLWGTASLSNHTQYITPSYDATEWGTPFVSLWIRTVFPRGYDINGSAQYPFNVWGVQTWVSNYLRFVLPVGYDINNSAEYPFHVWGIFWVSNYIRYINPGPPFDSGDRALYGRGPDFADPRNSTWVSNYIRYVQPSGPVLDVYGRRDLVTPSQSTWVYNYVQYVVSVTLPDNVVVWDDYGPIEPDPSRGGAKIYVRDGTLAPPGAIQTQFGSPTVT